MLQTIDIQSKTLVPEGRWTGVSDREPVEVAFAKQVRTRHSRHRIGSSRGKKKDFIAIPREVYEDEIPALTTG